MKKQVFERGEGETGNTGTVDELLFPVANSDSCVIARDIMMGCKTKTSELNVPGAPPSAAGGEMAHGYAASPQQCTEGSQYAD